MQRYQGCRICAYVKERAGVHPFCVGHCPAVPTPIKSFDLSEHFSIHSWLAGLLKNKYCSREYLQDQAIKLLLWFTCFRDICPPARIALSECSSCIGQKWKLHLFCLRSFSPRITKTIKIGSSPHFSVLLPYHPTCMCMHTWLPGMCMELTQGVLLVRRVCQNIIQNLSCLVLSFWITNNLRIRAIVWFLCISRKFFLV